MRRIFLIGGLLAAFGLAQAAGQPYDEAADARADVEAALARAKADGKPVLLVFGANWCGDCKVLDIAFHQGSAAPLIASRFNVVKVNVGRFDRNVDLAQTYGVPLKKGIPAVAVLRPDGKVAHASQNGELADARKMGDQGIHDYFAKVAGAVAR